MLPMESVMGVFPFGALMLRSKARNHNRSVAAQARSGRAWSERGHLRSNAQEKGAGKDAGPYELQVMIGSEQAGNHAIAVHIDPVGRWHTGQTRHGHDVPGDDDQELRAC